MKPYVYASVGLLAAASVAFAGWKYVSGGQRPETIVLQGNVDLRQVRLPFNGQQRVASVLVEEGDRVVPGQLIARLETTRLEAAASDARARVEAQRRIAERLDRGTRREEIEQARAHLAEADADVVRTRRNNERFKSLSGTGAASGHEIDDAANEYESAVARQRAKSQALELAIAGPRYEDRAEAKATLLALEAQFALRQRELADADLRSPVSGVIRNRILEPGEMSAPGSPAVAIAVTDPKWVRAYVTETDLGKVRPGTAASVTVDAFPNREFAGWIGFVSPVAEFTPKTVETPELRTSLMYEVRVMFRDPADELRLGMPATVSIRPGQAATQPAK